MSVELSYVKEYLKTRIVLKIGIFEVTVTPKMTWKTGGGHGKSRDKSGNL